MESSGFAADTGPLAGFESDQTEPTREYKLGDGLPPRVTTGQMLLLFPIMLAGMLCDLLGRLPLVGRPFDRLAGELAWAGEKFYYTRLAPAPGRFRRGLGAAGRALKVPFQALIFVLAKLKLFTAIGTMLLSIGAYAIFWGWKFAVGFVLLLAVHEYGHVIQLRREGVKASAPTFIPFLGAVIGMKELPDSALAEARVGLAGPVLGSLGALVPFLIWQATGSHLMAALAFTGFFLNLFNLLPVLPLDGGRAMSAVSIWLWIPGFALLIVAGVLLHSPLIALIALLGGLEIARRIGQARRGENQRAMPKPWQRIAVLGFYLALAAALFAGMSAIPSAALSKHTQQKQAAYVREFPQVKWSRVPVGGACGPRSNPVAGELLVTDAANQQRFDQALGHRARLEESLIVQDSRLRVVARGSESTTVLVCRA